MSKSGTHPATVALTGSNNGANHDEFNRRGGGRLMMALLHSGAVDYFAQRHFNALQSSFDVAVHLSTHDLCITPMELGGGSQARCYPRNAPDVKSWRRDREESQILPHK